MTKNSLIRKVIARAADDTCSSLAYCASKELLLGGLVVLLCYVLAGIPLLLGYLHQCLTRVMAGDERLPGFGNLRATIGKGLHVSLLGLVYIMVVAVPFAALLLLEIFTMPGVVITRPGGTGDFLGYSARYSGFSIAVVIIGLTTLALMLTFSALFSNAWLRYAIDGNIRSALNPVATLKWTLANPVLMLNKMVSFGLIGAVFAVPGLLIVLMPGIDRTYSLPFMLFTAATPWLIFAGLISNTFVRGRQIRDLRETGKMKRIG